MSGDGSGKGRRRALLIGVRETPYLADHPELAERYGGLDFVDRDLSLVRTALEESDYTVEIKSDDTGRGPVIGAVSRFLASCEPGDTALLYFSGHGETVNDRDHLVLADSQADWPSADGAPTLDTNTLLRADPSELLRRLPSGVTAIVCLDICRSGGPRRRESDEAGGWLSGHEAYWLYSCGSGQRSYADPVAGSWFAQAFAEALSRVTPPTTFHEVARYTAAELDRIADAYAHVEPPTVAKRLPWPAGDAEHRDPVVCEGSEQTLEWTRIIRESGLWRHTSGAAVHERVKEQLVELVRWVVESSEGTAAHRDDPWTDPRYPARVEEQLSALVGRAKLQNDELLSPAETACLLAAAVVQEGVVTIALDELRRLLPGRLDPGPRGGDKRAADHDGLVREAARDVCRAHPQVLRATETLRGRGLKEATTAADHWLRHRFVADWDRLWEWEPPGVYPAVDELIGLVVKAIEAAADGPGAGPRGDEERREVDRQVRQVLGHLTVKPDRGPRISDTAHGEEWIGTRPVRGNQWRGHQLARLLWTAGQLAADPRRLSSVLVDHLGASEPIVPRQVGAALGSFDYEITDGHSPDSYGLAVRFSCPHPALHAALEELTLAADATVRAFGADAVTQPLLRGLPGRVTADELRPLPGRYKEPLERFRLAEDEIRPLLMGTQLYGDRMLAVRELYQNALDACRYRDMRRRYGRLPTSWDGTITLTQGRHDGRPYIECLDNGSGMTRAKLTSMFARAGKRYEQDPEFVQERRNWRREHIGVRAMNSRFGIGVFSYFMLADEVVVWTRAVDRFGRVGPEPALRADIQSGSGLLQIGTSHDAEVPEEGGTRVRLYLAEPGADEKQPSLVETLKELLWVTEHRVTAVESSESGEPVRELSWVPGALEKRDGWRGEPLPVGAEGDLWLVQGPGQLLLDGVRLPGAPEVFGRVINLRERHSPVPSVDRNKILSYDHELVTQEYLTGVREAVATCTEVSLPWLWRLASSAPRVAVAMLSALPSGTTATLQSDTGKRLGAGQVRLDRVGCLPSDGTWLDHYYAEPVNLDEDRPEESKLFQDWQATRLGLRQAKDRFAPESYPPPVGLDALVFLNGAPDRWATVLQAAAQAKITVRTALRALRRHAVMGLAVPAVEDLRSLDDTTVSQPAADLYSAYADLRAHVRNLGTPEEHRFLMRSHEIRRARPPAEHAPVLAVSALHRLTLGKVAELLDRLRLVDPTLPGLPPLDPALAERRLTRSEVNMLAVVDAVSFTTPWAEAFWLAGRVGPVDLLTRAASSSTPDRLAQLIESLRVFGMNLDGPLTEAARRAGTLPPDQRLLLAEDLDGEPPWNEGAISISHLLEASFRLGAPLGRVADHVNAGTELSGAHAPHIPEAASDWQVPEWVADTVQELAVGQADVPLRPWQIVGGFLNGDGDMSTLHESVVMLDHCGLVDWGAADDASLERQARSPHRLLVPEPGGIVFPGSPYLGVSGDLDGAGASPAYLMALAARDRTDLGTIVDALTDIETSLPLKIGQVAHPDRALRPTAEDVRTLCEDAPVNAPVRFRPRLTIGDVLAHAARSHIPLADSVTRLGAFTDLGVPHVPGDFTGPDAERLAAFEPDRFDHAAFDRGLLGPGTLGPLELLLVAGRFGWPIGRVYERYAPFRCLGLTVGVVEPDPEEAKLEPRWEDVILLTAELTGRAPALSGRVTEDHIALCAEETGLDEDTVLERLGRYARLFGLTVPAADDNNRKVS
ncbi:caspase family protein [Streptomyces sp. NPDC026672]|uniref:HD domain-containing protein n=1 Tax=unclassified Streptomyces TaxID=2593676 RepID=UPI003401FF95